MSSLRQRVGIPGSMAGMLAAAALVGALLIALLYQVEFTQPVACAGSTVNEAVALNNTWHALSTVAVVACMIGVVCCAFAFGSASAKARFWIALLAVAFIGSTALFATIAQVTSQPCYT